MNGFAPAQDEPGGQAVQKTDGSYLLSASDLMGHLGCRHLTALNRAVADGELANPPVFPDPRMEALRERGRRHEAAYVDGFRSAGLDVVEIGGVGIAEDAVAATRDAMARGVSIIVQGALRHGVWGGRADVLRRVERASVLGVWSYEAIDTKLARETKGGTVLQLCLYSDLLAAVQGAQPEFAYVVTPEGTQRFRINDYDAYYRFVSGQLEQMLAEAPTGATYPEPVAHCDVCRWSQACDAKRRQDDHLSLVANITKSQILELREHDAATLSALAAMPLPLQWAPSRGAAQSYEKIREQARVQAERRDTGKLVHELLPVAPGLGLARLPKPSPGDIFLDLEGDTLAPPNGFEYLFGYVYCDEAGAAIYKADWASSPGQEKAAFEAFIDFVMDRLALYPDLHIYHYAPYEPSAFKRLMGRYATREDELDTLLRSGRFVDLYGVVRNGVRCAVESYSIKRLEAFYGFERDAALPDANRSLARLEAALELGDPMDDLVEDRSVVELYNRDDCFSTLALRTWLESLRDELVQAGAVIERPIPGQGEAPEAVAAEALDVATLVDRLTVDVPITAEDRDADQQARWLMAQTLSWHRREKKSVWWEFFRLRDLSADDLLGERSAISGLQFETATDAGTDAAPVHRYRFPPQESDLRGGEKLRSLGGTRLGAVHALSLDERWVEIKRRKDYAGIHPEAVFAFDDIDTKVLAGALMRIGADVADNGLEAFDAYGASRALLIRRAPAPTETPLVVAGESTLQAATRLGLELNRGVLPIQGPPGAGKTYTGANMICALVRAGKRVGVTANSHKVIRNLLDDVIAAAQGDGLSLSCIQKLREPEDDIGALHFTTDNADVLSGLGGAYQVAGGTAFMWARADFRDAVDVLFVDEAAQMSLANVLAVSQAAHTLVLLGDPRQLEQPTKGSHPEGSGLSALEHILDGAQTIQDDRGLFLAETWRLHPRVCDFTSEVFYENRLRPRPGLEQQTISSAGRLKGSGLRYLPVVHVGNQNASLEEAEAVHQLVEDTLAANPTWIDRHGVERPIELKDILIVTPYNAQLSELQKRLPGARIGTVDKFQGQQAPIVIYSMTSSSSTDAPRGMEFLYSLNRLNVATSRAQCLCVLVASPALFEPDCKSPRQMQLANALCRYRELASALELSASAEAA